MHRLLLVVVLSRMDYLNVALVELLAVTITLFPRVVNAAVRLVVGWIIYFSKQSDIKRWKVKQSAYRSMPGRCNDKRCQLNVILGKLHPLNGHEDLSWFWHIPLIYSEGMNFEKSCFTSLEKIVKEIVGFAFEVHGQAFNYTWKKNISNHPWTKYIYIYIYIL